MHNLQHQANKDIWPETFHWSLCDCFHCIATLIAVKSNRLNLKQNLSAILIPLKQTEASNSESVAH